MRPEDGVGDRIGRHHRHRAIGVLPGPAKGRQVLDTVFDPRHIVVIRVNRALDGRAAPPPNRRVTWAIGDHCGVFKTTRHFCDIDGRIGTEEVIERVVIEQLGRELLRIGPHARIALRLFRTHMDAVSPKVALGEALLVVAEDFVVAARTVPDAYFINVPPIEPGVIRPCLADKVRLPIVRRANHNAPRRNHKAGCRRRCGVHSNDRYTVGGNQRRGNNAGHLAVDEERKRAVDAVHSGGQVDPLIGGQHVAVGVDGRRMVVV